MNELRLTVNGEQREASAGTTVAALLQTMGIDPARVAVERNRDVVPRATWARRRPGRRRQDRDRRFHWRRFGGGRSGRRPAPTKDDPLMLGGRKFNSRLLIGTGKYRTLEEGREAILRSGAEIVTVALRRVDLTPGKPNVLDTIDRTRHTILPNTAGCYTAEDAIRTCRLARELGHRRHRQARGHRRRPDAVPGRRGDPGGGARPGQGRLHRPPLLHGRSDPRPEAGRRRAARR